MKTLAPTLVLALGPLALIPVATRVDWTLGQVPTAQDPEPPTIEAGVPRLEETVLLRATRLRDEER